MEKVRQFCLSVVNAVFWIASAVVVILIFLNAARNYVNVVRFRMGIVCLFALLAVALSALLYFLFTRCKVLKTALIEHPFWVMSLLMVAVCIVQVLTARAVYTPIGWDVATIVNVAGDLQPDLATEYDTYLTWYPNNVLLTALFKLFYRLFRFVVSDVWLSSAILSVLTVDAGIILICLTAKRIFGLKVYYITLWLSLLLAAFHPTAFIPYSDAVAMPFTAGFLFSAAMILTVKNRRTQYVFSFIAGLLLLTGYFIKPTVLIAGLAAVILLVLSVKKPKPKHIISFCLSALLVVAGSGCGVLLNRAARPLVYSQVPTEQEQEQLEVPMTHFLMMGLNEREGYYGFFASDVSATLDIPGKQGKTEYHKEVIAQRLRDFGFFGLLKHCVNKAVWVTTDGTFFYGGEGSFHNDTPKKTEGLGSFLQNFTYAETELYTTYFGNFMQAIWLLTAIGMMLLACDRRKDRTPAQRAVLFLAQLSVIGLIMFLALFEARSRYLFLYLPYFFLISATGYQAFFARLRARKERG